MTEANVAEERVKGNPILSLPLEIRLFLDSQCRTKLTHKEIKEKLILEFPWLGSQGITTNHIRSYRTKTFPNYKELILQRYGLKAETKEEFTPEIEAEILEEVKEAEEEGEEFTKEEQRKINMLRAHRKLLSELWANYQKVKNSQFDVAKGRYIQLMAEELGLISQLESSEKSFLSAMDEIRKAEQKMSIESHVDSLKGWFWPRAMEKAKDTSQAQEFLVNFQSYLTYYGKLLSEHSVADANRILLERLYSLKKVKEAEETNV